MGETKKKPYYKSDTCEVSRMENETGDGISTTFRVFPGIYLLHSDFHMQECPTVKSDDADILWLDFCREGRVEWEISKDKYVYLESGNYVIDIRAGRKFTLHFPMGHYHGISLRIHMKEANQALADFIKGVNIDVYTIRDKFLSEGQPFITKGNEIIHHIFEEIEQVPWDSSGEYYKIKVLEILFQLKNMERPKEQIERPYFVKQQVEIVKEIRDFITASPEQHYTMEELSKRFEIPVSSLKRCFKGVYGTAIYSFMRSYRMDMAGHLLAETGETVAAIAAKVGYTNCSKFSEAFKEATGMTPIDYRKFKSHRE